MVATASRTICAPFEVAREDDPRPADRGLFRPLLAISLVAYASATFSPSALALLHAPPPALILLLRGGLAFLLAYLTWTQIGARRRRLADLPLVARRLVGTSYVLAALASVSVLWSEQPLEPIQGAVAYFFLVLLMHGLLIGRWTDVDVIYDDLAATLRPLVLILFVGLFASRFGVVSSMAEYGRGGNSGLFDNPNTTAMVAVLVTFLSLGLWSRTRSRWHLLASFIGGTALLLTQTRTALGAVLIAALWVMMRRRGRSLAIASITAVGGIIAITVAPALLADVPGPFAAAFERFQSGDKFNGRTDYWAAAVDMWQQQPFLGHGFGSAPNEYAKLGMIEAAHSTYFQVLLEMGLLGVVPFLILMAALLSTVRRGRIDSGHWGFVAAILSGLLIAVTESALVGFGQPFCWLFWLSAAAATSLVGTAQDSRSVAGARAP